MSWQPSIFTLLLGVAAIECLACAYYYRQRPGNAFRTAVLLLLADAVWSFAYLMELASVEVPTQYFWAHIVRWAECVVPTCWFVMCVQFCIDDRWLNRRRLALLLVAPLLMALLILTNDWHRLVWKYYVVDTAAFGIDSIGLGLWAYLIYAYVLVILSIAVVLTTLIRARRRFGLQAYALIGTVTAPWLVNVFTTFADLGPISYFDSTPIAVGLSLFVFLWARPRLRERDVIPVTRELIVDTIGDGVVVLDWENRLVDANPSARRLMAREWSAAAGRPLAGGWPELYACVESILPRQAADREITLERGGESSSYDLTLTSVEDWQGRVAARVLVLHDITLRKRSEEKLRESEERYSLAARGSSDGIWDWDLRRDAVYYSPRWKEMFGYGEAEIGAAPEEWFGRIHPEDRPRVEAEIAALAAGASQQLESEHRLKHRDGDYRWVQCRGLAVRNEGGTAYRMAGSLSDITPRKRIENQLLHDAFHDPLTGQPNRALFLDRLGQSLERARRSERYRFAVLFLDLDNFKILNDSLGHFFGDRVVVEFGRRIRLCVRSVDTVARLGGDEFVVLLEDIDGHAEATRVADRIQSEFKSPLDLEGRRVFCTASIGIVMGSSSYASAEEILRDADISMYAAKAQGKARYQVFTSNLRDKAMARLELEKDLRGAIERREFRIHYQPIVSMSSRRIVGFEALVRWQHPERGLLPPAEFISIAEETGAIVPLGEWVLQEACRQISVWQNQAPSVPPLTVSVNLSIRQLTHADLSHVIECTLRENDLAASSLKLEITESLIMEDAGLADQILTKLRALGVGIQVDDFGMGYSSLSRLERLPIDTIKIDRTFVSRVAANGNALALVPAIVALAHELNLDVVAEGIETEEQSEIVRKLRCEYGQGFLFSRPVDVGAATSLIAAALRAATPGAS